MAKRTTKKPPPTSGQSGQVDNELLDLIIRVSGQGKAQAARTIADLEEGAKQQIIALGKQPNCGTAICQLLTKPKPSKK